jgi:hypothetical protein
VYLRQKDNDWMDGARKRQKEIFEAKKAISKE